MTKQNTPSQEENPGNEDRFANSNKRVGALFGSLMPGLFGEFVLYYQRWIYSPGYEYVRIQPEFKEQLLSVKDNHYVDVKNRRCFCRYNRVSLPKGGVEFQGTT